MSFNTPCGALQNIKWFKHYNMRNVLKFNNWIIFRLRENDVMVAVTTTMPETLMLKHKIHQTFNST